jgi:copper homeostasis protein CutC
MGYDLRAVAEPVHLAEMIATAQARLQPVAGLHVVAEEPHAFAEIGDDEVHVTVVVEVGDGEAAADVLFA